MSGVKPTREGPAIPIPESGEVSGDVDGDNVDWPTGPVSDAGIYELVNEGGQSRDFDLGTMGSAIDLDPTDGNVQYGELDDDCLLTLLEPSGPDAATVELWVTQDGTGGWVLTVDADGGSFDWDGTTPAPDTAAGVTVRYIFERVPGSTNDWVGNLVGGTGGGGGTPATTVTDETTLGISPAVGTDTEYARQDHTHGSPDTDAIKDAGRWEHAVIPGSPPDDLYADGDWLYIWVP